LAIRHLVAAVALSVSLAGAAHADEPGSDGSEDAARTDLVRPVVDQTITSIPGKSMVAQEVSYAPGGKDGPRRHAQSAFIMAYVISGAILSQVEGEPAHIYRAGQTWQEDPGAHHVVAENASKTEPARLLAVFVVDTADENALTTFDMKPEDNHD
jgi:quercetin dioxygenase-like cupin family protein